MINKMEQPQHEISEVVKKAFNKLQERMEKKDLIFKDESGDQRFYVIKSPAGNIVVHSYKTGHDYLLWEDGNIEALDSNDPENIVNDPTAQELNSMIDEIEMLKDEEFEHPK